MAKACKAGVAKVTALSEGKPHPYHLQAVAGKGSTVYGWVNEADIAGLASGTTQKTYTVVKGDNLTKIAKKYGTTVDTLVALNGIKNKNLIERLEGKTGEERSARFVCAIAACFPDGRVLTTRVLNFLKALLIIYYIPFGVLAVKGWYPLFFCCCYFYIGAV